MAHRLRWLHGATGLTNVAVSGGAFMNSVYNGKLLATTPFRHVFISSCPDDSGTSVGAALYLYHCILGGTVRHAQTHNYWGPEFNDAEIAESLRRYKIAACRHDEVEEVAAAMLADGLLVGWFQGRMEFGQRALGNRSILADPRDPAVKDRVNRAVKYREAFRPFAPSILEEFVGEYFVCEVGLSVPFMERVVPVRPEKRDLIGAVVHVDGTGRLHTVARVANPRFQRLLEAFHRRTGVPVLLNTSFNLNGEPIVCTPTDAIRTFYSCGLDGLVLGNYVIRKDGPGGPLGQSALGAS